MVKLQGLIFLIKDDELLKKYNNIWIKISTSIKEELTAKIRCYGDEAADFHTRKISKAGSKYSCQSVILIDYVLRKVENCCTQVYLKECKYIKKEKKQIRNITDYFQISDKELSYNKCVKKFLKTKKFMKVSSAEKVFHAHKDKCVKHTY